MSLLLGSACPSVRGQKNWNTSYFHTTSEQCMKILVVVSSAISEIRQVDCCTPEKAVNLYGLSAQHSSWTPPDQFESSDFIVFPAITVELIYKALAAQVKLDSWSGHVRSCTIRANCCGELQVQVKFLKSSSVLLLPSKVIFAIWLASDCNFAELNWRSICPFGSKYKAKPKQIRVRKLLLIPIKRFINHSNSKRKSRFQRLWLSRGVGSESGGGTPERSLRNKKNHCRKLAISSKVVHILEEKKRKSHKYLFKNYEKVNFP